MKCKMSKSAKPNYEDYDKFKKDTKVIIKDAKKVILCYFYFD